MGTGKRRARLAWAGVCCHASQAAAPCSSRSWSVLQLADVSGEGPQIACSSGCGPSSAPTSRPEAELPLRDCRQGFTDVSRLCYQPPSDPTKLGHQYLYTGPLLNTVASLTNGQTSRNTQPTSLSKAYLQATTCPRRALRWIGDPTNISPQTFSANMLVGS